MELRLLRRRLRHLFVPARPGRKHTDVACTLHVVQILRAQTGKEQLVNRCSPQLLHPARLQNPQYQFREAVDLGTTPLSKQQVGVHPIQCTTGGIGFLLL